MYIEQINTVIDALGVFAFLYAAHIASNAVLRIMGK